MNILQFFTLKGKAKRQARKADKIASPLTNIVRDLQLNNEQLHNAAAEITAEMNVLEATKQDLYATIANNERVISNLKGVYTSN